MRKELTSMSFEATVSKATVAAQATGSTNRWSKSDELSLRKSVRIK